MDFAKLSANEKLATYGAVALVIAGIISNWGGLLWLSILAGLVALVVIFLPQFSPTTTLPGSKGSLLVAAGGIAAAGAVIEILRYLYFFRTLGDWQTLLFLVALIGALVLAWAGWQLFQAEGGKFTVGMAGSGTGATPAAPPAPSAQATPAAPPATPAPPAEPMRTNEPMRPDEPMSPPAGTPPSMGGNEDDQR